MWNVILDLIFPPRKEDFLVRSATEEDIDTLISPRLVETTIPATIVLLPFKSPLVRALVHECKFHNNKQATKLLAHALSVFLDEYVIERIELAGSNITIIPMPISLSRYRERGYNQAANVTERAAKKFDLPHKTLLAKIRDTKSQVSLGKKERLRNQEGAFASEKVSAAVTYVLVDDVVTTGATMNAAIEALKKGGAENIVPIALAH